MSKVTFFHKEKEHIKLILPVKSNGDLVTNKKGFVDLGKQNYRKSKMINEFVIERDFKRI
jgi:hypothetical protein